MNPNIAYAYLLLNLKILSENDPIELLRVTDISKSDIDKKLNSIIHEIESKEVKHLYDEFNLITEKIRNPNQLKFLYNQIQSNAFTKAQYYSILYTQSQNRDFEGIHSESDYYKEMESLNSEENDILKLATMKLLRLLPGYRVYFEYKLDKINIDCLLQNKNESFPNIIIEFKSNQKNTKDVFLQLKKAMKLWGKRTIGILIVNNVSNFIDKENLENVYVINYNEQLNSLFGKGYEEFLKNINEIYFPSNINFY